VWIAYLVQQVAKKKTAGEEETHMTFIEEVYDFPGIECDELCKNTISTIAL
jgi:hypothetical protein